MNKDELKTRLLGELKEAISVTEVGDGVLQIGIPIFLADGDGVQIYARHLEDGSYSISDLGTTWMRLSYKRELSAREHTMLSELAEEHNFMLDEGRLIAAPQTDMDLVALALSLAQIEVAAEATIQASSKRARRSDAIVAEIADSLHDLIRRPIHVDYIVEEDDPEGNFPLDIFIESARPVIVSVAADNASAERAVSTRLAHPGISKSGQWLAVTKSSKIRRSTMNRLVSQYTPIVTEYDTQFSIVPERIRQIVESSGPPLLSLVTSLIPATPPRSARPPSSAPRPHRPARSQGER